jgi:hypothetical protein
LIAPVPGADPGGCDTALPVTNLRIAAQFLQFTAIITRVRWHRSPSVRALRF